MTFSGFDVDIKTTIVMFFFMAIFTAATIYLFKFHSDSNFAVFVGGFTAMGCIMHWIVTYDDKHPDQH
jgi:membrane-bound metal-dependent hydrolase YbcI (DUF457 family)